MIGSRRVAVWSLAIALTSCAPSFDEAAVEQEAERFMEEYAQDLANHDRDGIVDRYDRRGVHLLLNGQTTFRTFESVRAAYGDSWQGPAAFQWGDLAFEVLSPDAVMVVTRLLWTPADTLPPMSFSYASLLIRQRGTLRIRLESEVLDTTGNGGL